MEPNKMGAEFSIRALVCDEPGCNYSEEVDVKTEADVLAHVGKVCPWCGAVLLTQASADQTINHMRLIAKLNNILRDMPVPEGPLSTVKVSMRGKPDGGISVTGVELNQHNGD